MTELFFYDWLFEAALDPVPPKSLANSSPLVSSEDETNESKRWTDLIPYS